MRKEYGEAVDALQAAQTFADELEPRPGESVSSARMEHWAAAKQLVDILQAEVNRLSRMLADEE